MCPYAMNSKGEYDFGECHHLCPRDCPSGYWKCDGLCISAEWSCGSRCLPGMEILNLSKFILGVFIFDCGNAVL